MTTKAKNHGQSQPLKKPYSSPLLTHFGTIKELTSGGSGVMGEFGTPMMRAMQLMRHP